MKISEIRELTTEELTKKIEELKEELFNLRFANATGNLENLIEFIMKEKQKVIQNFILEIMVFKLKKVDGLQIDKSKLLV